MLSVRVRAESPFYEQTLHLRAADTKHLLELARNSMPRCGAKVKTVVLTWWTDVDLRNLPRESRTSEIQQALDAAETFIGLENAAAHLEKVLLLHDALIATILRACSNLLDLKVLRRIHRVIRSEGDHHVEIHSKRTLSALADIGGRITAAGLSLGAMSDLHMGLIVPLGLMPNITHLSIRVIDHASNNVMWNVFWSVCGLQELVSLELDTAGLSAWMELQMDIPRKMTQFILSGVRDLQLMQLADVLTAAPIVSLCLRHFSVAHFQLPFRRPNNLRIEKLSIAGCTAPSLLDFFDSAPIKTVEFCADRQGRSDHISPKRLRAFVRKHRNSLLSVKVHTGALGSSADVARTNHSLEREGISVRVKTFG